MKKTSLNFTSNMALEVPTKGFDFLANYPVALTLEQRRAATNTPNQAFNFQTNAFGSRVYVGPNAGVSNNTNNGYKTLLNGRLNYNTDLGKNHSISALMVYGEEYWYDRFQGSSRNDRLYPTLHEIDAALTDIQTTGGNLRGCYSTE